MNLTELENKMKKFGEMYYIIIPDKGHLVWRYGTGDNVEIFDIEAYKKRQGVGKELFRMLIGELGENPPHAIFAFVGDDNTDVQKFYKVLGFDISHELDHLYRYGARLVSASYKKVKKL